MSCDANEEKEDVANISTVNKTSIA